MYGDEIGSAADWKRVVECVHAKKMVEDIVKVYYPILKKLYEKLRLEI